MLLAKPAMRSVSASQPPHTPPALALTSALGISADTRATSASWYTESSWMFSCGLIRAAVGGRCLGSVPGTTRSSGFRGSHRGDGIRRLNQQRTWPCKLPPEGWNKSLIAQGAVLIQMMRCIFRTGHVAALRCDPNSQGARPEVCWRFGARTSASRLARAAGSSTRARDCAVRSSSWYPRAAPWSASIRFSRSRWVEQKVHAARMPGIPLTCCCGLARWFPGGVPKSNHKHELAQTMGATKAATYCHHFIHQSTFPVISDSC